MSLLSPTERTVFRSPQSDPTELKNVTFAIERATKRVAGVVTMKAKWVEASVQKPPAIRFGSDRFENHATGVWVKDGREEYMATVRAGSPEVPITVAEKADDLLVRIAARRIHTARTWFEKKTGESLRFTVNRPGFSVEPSYLNYDVLAGGQYQIRRANAEPGSRPLGQVDPFHRLDPKVGGTRVLKTSKELEAELGDVVKRANHTD